MAQKWVTVFSGSFSRALVIRTSFEARGIPTFMPDEMTKVIDPFITGANPFAVELRVPADALAEAQAVVASLPQPEEAAPSAAERETRRVASLSRAIRWCLIFPLVGWAIGSWLGFRYLAAARREPISPPHHAMTIAAWCAEMFLLVAILAVPRVASTLR